MSETSPAPEAPPPAPHRRRRSALAEGLAVVLAYVALTLLFLRPPLTRLDEKIGSDLADPVFNLYLMQWGAHQMAQGMPSFWHAPIFYPERWATTFSDHMLLPAALCGLAGAAGIGPIAAYNLLLLASFVLGGTFCYLVLRRLGCGRAGAFLGGTCFAFAPFRFDQLPHLQILLAQWIPLVLWTFDRLLERPSGRRAAVFLPLYALHVLGGNYLAYMLHLPLAALALNRLLDGPSRATIRARWAFLAMVATACAALTVGVYWPYAVTSRGLGLRRSAAEMLEYGGSLLSYAQSAYVVHGGVLPGALQRPENSLFAGFLGTLFAGLGVVAVMGGARTPGAGPPPPRRGHRAALTAALSVALALAIAGVVLGELLVWRRGPLAHGRWLLPFACLAAALGTALLVRRWRGPGRWDWMRLPVPERGVLLAGATAFAASLGYVFLPLARVLPGLQSMRVPTRFYPFVSFAIALLVAKGYELVHSRTADRYGPNATRLLLPALLLAAVVDLHPDRIPWPRVPDIPPIYQTIAADPSVRALLEIPFAVDRDVDNIVYLRYQTAHWKPIVNGYSGFLPPGYGERRARMAPFPDAAGVAELRRLGVTHVVVHFDLLPRWLRRQYGSWLAASGLSEVAHSERVTLLSTAPAAGAPKASPTYPPVP